MESFDAVSVNYNRVNDYANYECENELGEEEQSKEDVSLFGNESEYSYYENAISQDAGHVENLEKVEPTGKQAEENDETVNIHVSLLGSGKYEADGKRRAEDTEGLDSNVLSKEAKTLSENEQIEYLQKSGINTDNYTACTAEDGSVCFKSKDGTKFFRVVNHNNQNKLINTTMNGNKANFNIYTIDVENTKKDSADTSKNPEDKKKSADEKVKEEKLPAEDKKVEDKKAEDKKAEDKKAEDKKAEDKKAEDKKAEDKKAEDKKAEDKKAEDKKAEDKKAEDKKAEDKKAEDKKAEDKKAEEEKKKAEAEKEKEVKIAEAEKKVAEAEKKAEEAKKKAEAKIAEAEKKVAEAEKKAEEAKKKAEAKIAEAEKKVAEAEKKVEEAKKKAEGNERTEKVDNTNKKTSINVEKCVDDLYLAMDGLGTDENTLESILFDKDISDEDFVSIIKRYEEKYGTNANKAGLLGDIDGDTSGELLNKLTKQISTRLVNSAKNGNEEAFNVLSKEIFLAMEGDIGNLDSFLNSVLEEMDDETVVKLNKKYSEINEGKNLVDDIKDQYSGILGWRKWLPGKHDLEENGAKILERINKALRHHSEN